MQPQALLLQLARASESRRESVFGQGLPLVTFSLGVPVQDPPSQFRCSAYQTRSAGAAFFSLQ